jgi:hypothetical protein
MGGRVTWVALLLLAACKAELTGDGNGVTADASSSEPDGKVFQDADIDAPVMLGAWGTPSLVIGASDDTIAEDDGTMSSDTLELYFKRNDGGDNNIYVMTRQSTSSPWSMPDPVTAVNTTAAEESPRLSSDNLTMYFGRAGDIYKVTRANVGAAWGDLVAVTPLNTPAPGFEKWGVACTSGYAMVSRDANNGNGQDVYDGTITGGTNNAVTTLNTTSAEQGLLLSSDCMRVYFQSNRDNDQFDIYEASRTSPNAAWSNPTKMVDFNTTTSSEEDAWISPDQRTFLFVSNVNGTKDLFIVTR